MKTRYIVESFGASFIAHREDCDCLADDAQHGVADHPTAALRALMKVEGR